ncbi:MAG: hypothetical protein JNK02_02725 [Planctomycetes bacterium]|nr:hypothetical protein [Planctomycetota bacterium]
MAVASVTDAPPGFAVPAVPRTRFALAWLLACAPLALGWLGDAGPDRFAGVALAPLAALPAVLVAGMPRRAQGRAPLAQELAAVLLLAPPLAAAAGLDVAQGAPPARALGLVALALAIACVLGDAARRAAADARSARLHALLWFALVAGPGVLLFALESGGGPFLGEAPAVVHALWAASAPGILAAQVRDVSAPLVLAPSSAALGLAALCVVAFAPALARRGGMR